MSNENIIYVAYSSEVIDESLNTFRDSMQNGASVEQLLSGLAGLDYICYASELSAWQQERLNSLRLEADIRIDLDKGRRGNVSVDAVLKSLLYQINNLYSAKIINNKSSLEHILDYLKHRKEVK